MDYWKPEQIRRAIERGEAECERMVKAHETPEKIDKARESLVTLRRWLEISEREYAAHQRSK